LPFKKGSKVSVFGRVQNDWFFTGYGSGGDVKKPYGVNLIDGLKNCEDLTLNTELSDLYETWCGANPVDHGVWGHWPRFYNEMPLTAEIVKSAKENSDHAVYVIGRSSGEDRENALEKGSFYVTDEERNALHRICEQFQKVTLVFNIGSVIDMSWIREFEGKIGAILIVWQGGMESGNAVADLLCGKVNPSGKLTDTIAVKYEDYPSSAHFGDLKSMNMLKIFMLVTVGLKLLQKIKSFIHSASVFHIQPLILQLKSLIKTMKLHLLVL
jgi:beta-glucosidase